MKQLLVLSLLVLAACATTPTGNVVAEDAQVVQVSVVGPNYQFSPSTVEAGKPVRLEFATAPPGCARAFTIPSYGISQVVGAGSTVEFTPTSSGAIPVACSMNMYTGQLVVR